MSEKRKCKAKSDRFTCGFLCACQEIVLLYGEDSIAENIMKDCGITKDEFITAQKESGYQNKKMLKLIRGAFQ